MRGVKRLGLVAAIAAVGLAPATAAQAAQPSNQDRQFLESIHQVNLFEIAAGGQAQQKAANQQVKDLGGRLVTDHTQLDQTVQNTASQTAVTLPGSPTQEQQSNLDQLNSISGNEYDQRWVSIQLTGHQQAIQMVDTEIRQGSDAAVKQVAQDARPVLQAHHDALVNLARQLGVAVPTASPTGTGTPSPTGTATPTDTGSPTDTGTPTETGTPSPTGTGVPSPTQATSVPSPTGS